MRSERRQHWARAAATRGSPVLRENGNGENMDKIIVLAFLFTATSLEAIGNAVVRMGIFQIDWMPRCLLFGTGAVLLFSYGLSLNLAPVEFGRVIGLYITTLFVVWQLVDWFAFESPPTAPIVAGGALIVGRGSDCHFLGMTPRPIESRDGKNVMGTYAQATISLPPRPSWLAASLISEDLGMARSARPSLFGEQR